MVACKFSRVCCSSYSNSVICLTVSISTWNSIWLDLFSNVVFTSNKTNINSLMIGYLLGNAIFKFKVSFTPFLNKLIPVYKIFCCSRLARWIAVLRGNFKGMGTSSVISNLAFPVEKDSKSAPLWKICSNWKSWLINTQVRRCSAKQRLKTESKIRSYLKILRLEAGGVVTGAISGSWDTGGIKLSWTSRCLRKIFHLWLIWINSVSMSPKVSAFPKNKIPWEAKEKCSKRNTCCWSRGCI